MGPIARLRWWRSTKVARRERMAQREVRSWKAEHAVGAAAKRVASTKHVHLAIRIPDPDRPRGSGEVDVIAITDRAVILLEVKNWGGDVLLQNNDLVQQRLLDKGEPPKPVIEKLRAKVRMLQRCSLSIDQIEMLEVLPIVVLANPKGNLSEEVLAHPEVSTVADLPAKIESLLATRKPASEEEIARQDAMLRRFGTWDVLTFDGGQRHTGDLIDVDLPEGWARADHTAIEVAVEGGWFPTLLRGPRLNVTFHRRDGTTTTETMAPGLTVRHTQPWDDSGIDGKGTYPIEHVRKVLFGNAAPFSWEGVQRGSTSGEGPEETGEVEKDPLADFEVGGTYTGTVVKHMHGKADGVFFGYLVVLKERQVKGLLHANKMVGKSQTMLDMMYAKGNPIRVKILSIRGPDRIELDFADEDESE
ncbi:MAG: nuclease-related domain-containing protein [Candidatus Thermoplasmatota archaeon]|nr:nuclease-related domain-containing protein [Candidatus Thermoplasmatota archaeon]MEC8742558.1 nuclease-related domain-containing protein [Candidatus Thermoplasmatota archaeon]